MLRRILILGILALAAFGAYTLYQDNKSVVDDGYSKAQKKVEEVRKVLKD